MRNIVLRGYHNFLELRHCGSTAWQPYFSVKATYLHQARPLCHDNLCLIKWLLQSVLGYLHATRLSFPEFTAAYTCIRITWCVILIVLCVRSHWFQLCLNRFNEYIQTSYLKKVETYTYLQKQNHSPLNNWNPHHHYI